MRSSHSSLRVNAILLLSTLILLSGCSLIWALPLPGAVTVIIGLLLALATGTTYSKGIKGQAADSPVSATSATAPAPALGWDAAQGPALVIVPAGSGEASSGEERGTAKGDSLNIHGTADGDGFGPGAASLAGAGQALGAELSPIGGDGLTHLAAQQWLEALSAGTSVPAPILVLDGEVLAGRGDSPTVPGAAAPASRSPWSVRSGQGDAAGDGMADLLARSWLVERYGSPREQGDFVVIGTDGTARPGKGSGAAGILRADDHPARAGGAAPLAVPAVESVAGDSRDMASRLGIVRVGDHGERMNPKEGDPEAVQKGAVIFQTRCGTYCHGGGGVGGGCPSLIDEVWIHGNSDLNVYRIIVGGAPNTRMGSFGAEFTMDQVWEIIAYLRDRHRTYLLETAGPKSLMEKVIDCGGDRMVNVVTLRGREITGLLVKEDVESVTVEDRSDARPTQTRVPKEQIDTAKAFCSADKSDKTSSATQ